MKPTTFMLIAGEASGDLLAAELVGALRKKVLEIDSAPTADAQPLRTELAPRFFGAGGPRMKAAGVDLAFDLTRHSVTGLSDVVKKYLKFRQLFRQLLRLAIERQPDVIIGVDYGGFNLRFAHAIKQYVRRRLGWFQRWNPKLVQYVSPQVWASRPGRAYQMEEDHDLVLSIFPFEMAWYAKRVPKLRVEFVGHPMVERYSSEGRGTNNLEPRPPCAVLLPGSREDELRRHLPVLYDAATLLKKHIQDLQVVMVLPDEKLRKMVDMYSLFGIGAQVLIQSGKAGAPSLLNMQTQVGELGNALMQADVAITKSGTVTMECAFFGVPAVVFYKTSWPTYLIGKQIVRVPHLAMPNLLAGETVFPEFVQHTATPENIAGAALELLRDETRRQTIKAKLARIVASLGGPGASGRAAAAIVRLLQ